MAATEGGNGAPAYQSAPMYSGAHQQAPAVAPVVASAPYYPDLNAAPADNFDRSSPPPVKYVDQNGNPIQMPAANVRYVDQNGNPIPNPNPVPMVRYVDQNGNPVAPPQTQSAPAVQSAASGAPVFNAQDALRSRKTFVMFSGIVSTILLIAGLFINTLAKYDDYGYVSKCRWTDFYVSSDYDDYSSDYGDLCDSNDWCGTQSAAMTALIFTIIAAGCALLGTVSMGISGCSCNPNWFFAPAVVCCLVSVLGWSFGDSVCISASSEMNMGWTFYCVIIAAIAQFLICFVVRAFRKLKSEVEQGLHQPQQPQAGGVEMGQIR